MRLRISNTRQLLGGKNPSFQVDYWQVPKIFLSEALPGPRIYFADRLEGRSHIFSIDLDRELKPIISSLQQRLAPSTSPGTFDDEGVMPADVVRTSHGAKLLYSGWNSRNTVPYHNSTGLADLDESGDLIRTGRGPVMERNWQFPYLAVTPTVWGSGPFHCIYVNGDGWFHTGAETYEPLYSLRYAYSDNLTVWKRDDTKLVSWSDSRPCHSNPCHLSARGRDIIVYCDRAASDYRADADSGYEIAALIFEPATVSATKLEIEWTEERLIGMNDQMRAYPEVFEWEGDLFLLTNGNGFGRTGIFISQLEIS
jgi:hypothetical protein